MTIPALIPITIRAMILTKNNGIHWKIPAFAGIFLCLFCIVLQKCNELMGQMPYNKRSMVDKA